MNDIDWESVQSAVRVSRELFDAAESLIKRHDEHARRCNFQWCGCDDCNAFRPIINRAKGESK